MNRNINNDHDNDNNNRKGFNKQLQQKKLDRFLKT